MKSDDGILFTAPVMIPDAPDCDYERGEKPFTAEEIQFFKNSFDDYQFIDKEHQIFKDIGSAKTIADPIESFTLNEDTEYRLVDGSTATYPKGTWMLTSNVTDPISQQEIMDGKLTGYSVSVHREDVGKLIKEYMATKASGGQLIHDIPNPNAITVSIVGKPCQRGSKQCELNGSDVMSDDKKTLDKIREMLTGNPEEYATKSDFDAFAEELKKSNDAAMKSLAEEIGTIVGNSIKEALAEVGATKADKPEEEEETPAEEEEKPEENNEAPANEEEETPAEEEEKPKNKGKSKTPPVHDGASKSDIEDLDVYTFLGRNPDGTRKRE